MQNSNFFPTLHWEIAVFNLFILEVKKRVKKMERGEKKQPFLEVVVRPFALLLRQKFIPINFASFFSPSQHLSLYQERLKKGFSSFITLGKSKDFSCKKVRYVCNIAKNPRDSPTNFCFCSIIAFQISVFWRWGTCDYKMN